MKVIQGLNTNFLELREHFGCSQEMMARIIGVSSKTVARWEADTNEPMPLARWKVEELISLLKKMRGIIKAGKEKEWLNTPIEVLDFKTPVEKITQGPQGVREVERLLISLEWGIPE